jgi:hypothetical protein
MKQDLIVKKAVQDKKYDFESEQNLIGLFALLYKIDKRNNPDLYKRKLIETNQIEL